MKHVLLYAYTAHNVGDDLFIEIVCRRYPQTTFYIYAPRTYQQTFQHIHNLHILSWPISIHRPFLQQKMDLVLYIGGSLFMQQGNWQKELRRVQHMKIKDKPFFILGANFGPFYDEIFIEAYEKVFAACTDICFRDQSSYKLFKHLQQVRQADDIIFQYEAPFSIKSHSHNEKQVVISVIYPSIRPDLQEMDERYFRKMSEITVTFIEKGYTVSLVGFCAEEKDDEAVNEIARRVSTSLTGALQTITYENDLRPIIQLIAAADIVIACRFHAMVLGWLYEKHVYPITYSKKMIDVMTEGTQYGTVQEIERVDMQKIIDITNEQPKQFEQQIIQAEQQFAVLDEYIG